MRSACTPLLVYQYGKKKKWKKEREKSVRDYGGGGRAVTMYRGGGGGKGAEMFFSAGILAVTIRLGKPVRRR